ncbi:MAG: hypothetical protein IKA25_00475 [Alphaproteobacteria bacterium]|nr:hypothetical protein [Alphaproteobacteria bacterium]
MAKIKRFYLLIAALIYSKSYAVNAAELDCSTITGLSHAQSCYTDWYTRYQAGNLTYSAYKNSGLFGGDYHTCYAWSDVAENGDEIDDLAHCTELYEAELAGACCASASTNNTPDCESILQGFDTCKSTSGSDTPSTGCVAKGCKGGYGLDPVEGCMKCDGGQYVKNNQTVESESGDCWIGPVCADCPDYYSADGIIEAYTSTNDEPGSSIGSCFISGDFAWDISDITGTRYETFLYNCYYGS